MKHTEIAVGETVYIKAKKFSELPNCSEFDLWDSDYFFCSDKNLEWAISDKQLQELREKAEKNFMPEVGKEYEFSESWNEWFKSIFYWFGYVNWRQDMRYIRQLPKTTTIEIPLDEELQKQVENVVRIWREKNK